MKIKKVNIKITKTVIVYQWKGSVKTKQPTKHVFMVEAG